MKMLLAVGLLSAGLVAAGVGPGEDRAGDAKRFEGTWQAVSVTHDGKELAKEKTEKMTLTVKGDRYTLKTASETIEGTHKLDPSKDPKTIDALRSSGPDRGKRILGIYELTGDSYKVCFAPPGKERPTEFSSKEGSGNRLIVMKREKP